MHFVFVVVLQNGMYPSQRTSPRNQRQTAAWRGACSNEVCAVCRLVDRICRYSYLVNRRSSTMSRRRWQAVSMAASSSGRLQQRPACVSQRMRDSPATRCVLPDNVIHYDKSVCEITCHPVHSAIPSTRRLFVVLELHQLVHSLLL